VSLTHVHTWQSCWNFSKLTHNYYLLPFIETVFFLFLFQESISLHMQTFGAGTCAEICMSTVKWSIKASLPTPPPSCAFLEIYFGPSSAKLDPFLFPLSQKSFHFSSLFPDISLLPSDSSIFQHIHIRLIFLLFLHAQNVFLSFFCY
jgi:hypothetical protein